jgi:hypothetical protein
MVASEGAMTHALADTTAVSMPVNWAVAEHIFTLATPPYGLHVPLLFHLTFGSLYTWLAVMVHAGTGWALILLTTLLATQSIGRVVVYLAEDRRHARLLKALLVAGFVVTLITVLLLCCRSPRATTSSTNGVVITGPARVNQLLARWRSNSTCSGTDRRGQAGTSRPERKQPGKARRCLRVVDGGPVVSSDHEREDAYRPTPLATDVLRKGPLVRAGRLDVAGTDPVSTVDAAANAITASHREVDSAQHVALRCHRPVGRVPVERRNPGHQSQAARPQ